MSEAPRLIWRHEPGLDGKCDADVVEPMDATATMYVRGDIVADHYVEKPVYNSLAKRLEDAERENRVLQGKAIRFDLDVAGIAQREAEAVELVELRAENTALRKDLGEAYGYLWSITDIGLPARYWPPEEAAYHARKLLLGHLTDEQKRDGITRARQGIDAAIAAEGKA